MLQPSTVAGGSKSVFGRTRKLKKNIKHIFRVNKEEKSVKNVYISLPVVSFQGILFLKTKKRLLFIIAYSTIRTNTIINEQEKTRGIWKKEVHF